MKGPADKCDFMVALTQCETLTDLAVRVGVHIMKYYNADDDYARPSFGKIAKEVGAERRSVIRAVDQLGEAGFYIKIELPDKTKPNGYRPNWELVTRESPALVTVESPPSDRRVTSTSDSRVTRTHLKNPLKEHTPPTPPGGTDDLDSGFEEFWQALPKSRKGGEKHCRQKYAGIIESGEATHAEIVAGAERYRRSGHDISYFTMAPMTFLKGAHWNDEDFSSPSDNRQSKPSGNPVIGTLECARMMLCAVGWDSLKEGDKALLRDAGEEP